MAFAQPAYGSSRRDIKVYLCAHPASSTTWAYPAACRGIRSPTPTTSGTGASTPPSRSTSYTMQGACAGPGRPTGHRRHGVRAGLVHHRPVPVPFPVGALQENQGRRQAAQAARPPGEHPSLHPHHGGKAHDVNVLDVVVPEPSTSWTAPTSTSHGSTPCTFTWRTSCSGRRRTSGSGARAHASPTGQQGSSATRLSGRPAPGHRSTTRRAPPHQIRRQGEGQVPGVPDHRLRPAACHHRRTVQGALSGRTVLQVDRAAPALQVLLRHVPERGEEPDVDCRLRVCSCRHHQETTRNRRDPPHNSTDPEREPFRKKAAPSTTCELGTQNRL